MAVTFVLLVIAGWLSSQASIQGCPFCSMQGQTLTGDVNQAAMVLFGTLENARLDPNGGFGTGNTDLRIEAIIKGNPILGDRKVITLPKYIPPAKYLVFCDVYNGKIDPYRGVPIKADSDMVKYLSGALGVRDKPIGQKLRYFFDFLDSSDLEVSNDAYKEFANADYKDYREMARQLPPDKIVKWLRDPQTPSFRYGLYASMLGHCGNASHAAVLKEMLNDPTKQLSSGVDGILAGYIMLQPKEGWALATSILQDPKKEFMFRYATLRVVRFLKDSRPDLVGKEDLMAAVHRLLTQPDIADLAIEDLRKWADWSSLGEVLALYDQKSHDVPIIKRAIVRFALACPEPKAAAFVQNIRKADPEMVKDVEELLKLETPAKAAK